ncbi:acylphosphatase [candidate division KSB1 bacterium]|nr:acylphosphatase [candidate division KSB1 bacterium]
MGTKIIKVSGRVQGVGFRYFVQKKAIELDIVGEVKNQPDGSVLIIAQGSVTTMNTFIQQVETGPSFSRVDQCVINDQDRDKIYKDFKITY